MSEAFNTSDNSEVITDAAAEGVLIPSEVSSDAKDKSPRVPREAWWYLGPAFVASVAYMDPGNFATNIEGGAPIRVRAALGAVVVECDGDFGAVSRRKAGNLYRKNPSRELPRGILASRRPVPVVRGRNSRDGNRSC